MANKFLAADLHLGHRGVCNFLAPNGVEKLRPWDTPEAMDEDLVKNWNKVVGPNDEVWVLGDVVINRKALPTIARLNGRKHLVKGNHDIFHLKEYQQYFYEVSACRVLTDMILTHIPIHPNCMGRFKTNVHGHLHAHVITREDGTPDPRYLCVSMEQINFAPISLDDVRARIKERNSTF